MLSADKDLFRDHIGRRADNTDRFSAVLLGFKSGARGLKRTGMVSRALCDQALNGFGIIQVGMLGPIRRKRRVDEAQTIPTKLGQHAKRQIGPSGKLRKRQ